MMKDSYYGRMTPSPQWVKEDGKFIAKAVVLNAENFESLLRMTQDELREELLILCMRVSNYSIPEDLLKHNGTK